MSMMSQAMSAPPEPAPVLNQSLQPISEPSQMYPHPAANLEHHMAANNMPQKTSMTMDSQYMQQQSQIFVFSTQLANQAAEAVDSGEFQSIIDFHCTHTGVKKMLDNKNQMTMKGPPFGRPNPAVWLNNLAQMKQGGRGMKPNINMTPSGISPPMLNSPFGLPPRGGLAPSCTGSCNAHTSSCFPPGPGPGGGPGPGSWQANQSLCSNAPWQQQPPPQQQFAQNMNDMNQNKFGNTMPGGPGPRPCGPGPGNSMIPCSNSFGVNNFRGNSPMYINQPGCNSVPPMTETPDENLTPQQRQHREKQLAIIKSLQHQLCPEMVEPNMNPQNNMRMPTPQQQPMDSCLMNSPMFGNNMCGSLPDHEVPNSDPSLNNLMNPSPMMSNNNLQFPQNQNQMPPTSGTSHMEWKKMQPNFTEETRRRKPQAGPLSSVPTSHPSPISSQPSSTKSSPSPAIAASPAVVASPVKMPLSPPPYSQAPSGMRPMASPHPASPATGSLPLSSPRMTSPADTSKQFPSGQQRLPHSSPGPTTPSDSNSNSISTSSVHSPKPLPPSLSASSTSSMPVSNSCSVPRTVASSTSSTTTTMCSNVTSNVAAPSTIAPSSSPSNVKKMMNLGPQTPKQLSQECGDLMSTANSNGNQMLNSIKLEPNLDSNRKPIASDPSMIGSSCSSPFLCNKNEPTLMPVPSPQQIQYCVSAFEGQELTIQKQPNTSLRDADLISPSDLDLGFPNEFNSCPPHLNERMPNFMDNMNPNRFPTNSPVNNMNMMGQFEMNQRFMNPDGNGQRFMGPGQVFEGPPPHVRMQGSHEMGSQFRPNMTCMPYGGGPQMEGPMMRFPNSCDGMMPPRMRGPSPMEMGSRFPPHINDGLHSPTKFGSSAMSPLSNEQMMQFPGSTSSQPPNCMTPVNNFNQPGVMDTGVSSTHLQNLQKMTPPFDIGPPNKLDGMVVPNGSIPHSVNPAMHNNNGPIPASQAPRSSHFDPIASMAAMGEQTAQNQNLMSSSSMNMSSMQVATNGPQPGNMVNFHTSMSSMHGIHQTMGPEGNPINGGMQSQYNMNQQMGHNLTGGPQTVNNTYVNATMSIQQLNIQNVTSPSNYNSNLDQNMNNPNMNMPAHNMQGPAGQSLSPPAGGNMQMMTHGGPSKMGQGFGSNRPPGPGMTGAFPGPQQMVNQRAMNPMNFPPNSNMMHRGGVYNAPNIQVKPDAPNTIQYLPARPQNPNSMNRPPSFDFLQRFAPPLTNLDNKLPTHNLQYFPNNGPNMNNAQGMPMQQRMVGSQNMAMASGPGRPPMLRNTNPNPMGPQPMMGSNEMYGRPPAPNNLGNIPPPNPGQPPNMFTGMKPAGSGPMSPMGMAPDSSQTLPPSVGHSYNYKQTQFYQPMNSDPNYAVQFHNFQQQLYATNTRNTNNSATNQGNNNPRVNSGMTPGNNFYSPPK